MCVMILEQTTCCPSLEVQFIILPIVTWQVAAIAQLLKMIRTCSLLRQCSRGMLVIRIFKHQ